MILYVGNMNSAISKQLTRVNHFCFSPDPKRRAYMPENAKVLLDSGAFQDVRRTRLTFEHALERQMAYEQKNGFVSERIVSYDLLIDEQMQSDRQVKARWTEAAGWSAVETTIQAAEYLSKHRTELAPRQLVLSCQGVTPEQYLVCMKSILDIAQADDCVGLGGWCIIGQQRHLIGMFWRAMNQVLPLISRRVQEVHIFGVTYTPVLREFAQRCRTLGLRASTDTTRFFFELSRGRIFDPQSGKSLHYPNAGNLAKNKELAVRNVETAYQFIQHIESWKAPHELF